MHTTFSHTLSHTQPTSLLPLLFFRTDPFLFTITFSVFHHPCALLVCGVCPFWIEIPIDFFQPLDKASSFPCIKYSHSFKVVKGLIHVVRCITITLYSRSPCTSKHYVYVIIKASLSNHHKQPAIALNDIITLDKVMYSNDVDAIYYINYYSSNYSTWNHVVP